MVGPLAFSVTANSGIELRREDDVGAMLEMPQVGNGALRPWQKEKVLWSLKGERGTFSNKEIKRTERSDFAGSCLIREREKMSGEGTS